MNRYMVSVNGRAEREIHAGRAAVAIKKHLDSMVESSLRPASITIRYVGKVTYTYEVIADVPFDYGENGKGRKREVVRKGLTSKAEAEEAIAGFKTLHPDWDFIHIAKRQVPLAGRWGC